MDDHGQTDREEIQRLLRELAEDSGAKQAREVACRAIAGALKVIGLDLWVLGYAVGPDRIVGASPFSFGSDRTVGVAIIAQMGGELAQGAIDLLDDRSLYAASALTRQIVEVEYLAFAFAEQHQVAADWLRSNRKERLDYWSPAKLRKRAGGRFLPTDYWHHCEMGGHPTNRGMRLLPGHSRLGISWLWVDLVGHLDGVWKHIVTCAERELQDAIPTRWNIGEVTALVREWLAADGFFAAVQDLGAILHEQPDSE